MAIVAMPLIGSTTKSYVCLSYCNPTLQKGRIGLCFQGKRERGEREVGDVGRRGGLHIFNRDEEVGRHGSAAYPKRSGGRHFRGDVAAVTTIFQLEVCGLLLSMMGVCFGLFSSFDGMAGTNSRHWDVWVGQWCALCCRGCWSRHFFSSLFLETHQPLRPPPSTSKSPPSNNLLSKSQKFREFVAFIRWFVGRVNAIVKCLK
jgi:hypothetical protein